jgi:uncharacterized membrane protein
MTRRMWLAALALLGIFIAAYLTLYHYGYIGSLACSGDGHGCETVQASRYARFMGLPVAAWGLGYYATVLVLAIVSMQDRFAESRGFATVLLALTGWGAVFSGYLTYLEAGPIGAWCQWCIGSATVAALLFIVALLDWRATRAVTPA